MIALVYIAVIAEIAYVTGAFYVLFPELGALSQDVFTRPRGTWASAPLLLAITPVLTGVIGIFFTHALPYGYLSVLLTVGGAVGLIYLLKSPIAPAISAGLLPLVLGVKSWWYPPGVMLGTVLLALLSLPWKRLCLAQNWLEPFSPAEAVDEAIEQTSVGSSGLIALMLFRGGGRHDRQADRPPLPAFPAAGRYRLRDVWPYRDLPVGQATVAVAGRLFPDRRGRALFLELARYRTGCRRL
jgi:hypothetical protein